jgi:two-component system phosphate regulon sensor histidine kinase PhoR
MIKRIFRSVCFVVVTVFFVVFLLIVGVLYSYFSTVQQTQLSMQTSLVAQGILHEGTEYFRGLVVEDYRITWIDGDGTVLYDSALDTVEMENHLEREEVKEALATGYGESRRYSATLTERSLYCARALSDGTIVRLSISQRSVIMLILGMVQPIAVIFAVTFLLSALLAFHIANQIVRPLNEINLDEPLSVGGYEELGPLLRRIDSQQSRLRRQESELGRKQKELDIIISNMNEGMILLNREKVIISMNPRAGKIMGVERECTGTHILSAVRDPQLREVLLTAFDERCGRGQDQTRSERKREDGYQKEYRIQLEEESYRVSTSPVMFEEAVIGTVVFFFDMTERDRAEQIRQEFTANVSHELKTPLHVISGYAELFRNNMVKEEDRILFAGKIYEETQRLIQLVTDIISLSRLDERMEETEREWVDLHMSAQEAIQNLETKAGIYHVTMELTGEPVSVYGIRELLYSIVYNLCDNAVQYNKEGGNVTVETKAEKGVAVLSVRDTGIGIDRAHQERIFERFYRVDKSRSRAAGSTGLGLSIVKHAVKLHSAGIAVDSIAGQGTTITVRFPEEFTDIFTVNPVDMV